VRVQTAAVEERDRLDVGGAVGDGAEPLAVLLGLVRRQGVGVAGQVAEPAAERELRDTVARQAARIAELEAEVTRLRPRNNKSRGA
jgi:hypothetical protein